MMEIKHLLAMFIPRGIKQRRRLQELSVAVFDALHDIGYDGDDCKVSVKQVQYFRVPRWMANRKHEIWHIIIHGWTPTKESWARYPGVVATRIHCLLAQRGFVTRVTLRKY